eukprot:scaffold90584_cov18-Tisochrysis_lutea.AAC.1
MLRQDPVECLFQFICSSNNHISRIGGMVERLCAAYGTPLVPDNPAAAAAAAPAERECAVSTAARVKDEEMEQRKQQQQQQEGGLHANKVHLQQAAFVTPLKGEPLITPLKREPDGDGLGDADLAAQAPQPQPPPLGRTRVAKRTTGASAHQRAAKSTGSMIDQVEVLAPLSPEPLQGQGADGVIAAAADEDDEACLGLVEGKRFYAFPTLQQLAGATEANLRAAGFGTGKRKRWTSGRLALGECDDLGAQGILSECRK